MKFAVRLGLLPYVLGALCASTAYAQDILITGATVHTVSAQGTLERADVLIRDGRIAAVGLRLDVAPNATVVHANGRPLTPGLFAGLSAIGLEEVSMQANAADAALALGAPAWSPRWHPEFDVTRAYNPRSTVIPVTRIEGFTWTMLTPGSDSLLAGQGAAVTLDGRFDAVLAGSRTLFVELGEGPLGSSGGTRASQFMLLEQAIREARNKGPMEQSALLRPAGREALAAFLNNGRILFVVNRAADIHALLAFARQYRIKAIIAGGAEAWVLAPELAEAQVPVILDPLENLPASFDKVGARADNAAILYRAGVRIAFAEGETHNARKIRQLAGNAVAHGLPWDAALAAVTAAPAEIFGLGATRGRIAVGQIADLALWSGDPLDVTTAADQVWIAGRPVEMRSRQTELRDRHLERVKQGQAR